MARTFLTASQHLLWVNAVFCPTLPMSTSVWFNLSALPAGTTYYSLLGMGSTNTSVDGQYVISPFIYETSPGVVQCRTQFAYSGAPGWTINPTILSANTWYHFAGTANVGQQISYVNGGSKTVDNGPLAQYTNLAYSSLGGFLSGNLGAVQWFSGRLAEAGVWNVQLTDDEVIALSKGVSPLLVRPSALQCYFPLYGNAMPEPNYVPKDGIAVLNHNGNVPQASEHTRVYQPWQSPMGDQGLTGWGPLLGQQRDRLVLQP